jgi:hypothetical protein
MPVPGPADDAGGHDNQPGGERSRHPASGHRRARPRHLPDRRGALGHHVHDPAPVRPRRRPRAVRPARWGDPHRRPAGRVLGPGQDLRRELPHRQPSRDSAVRSARLLDASAHPDITFISRRLGQADGRWALHGLLSVRGNAHPVELLIEEAQPAGQDLHVRASAGIDRYDFGITKVKGLAARHLGFRLDIVAHRL